MALTNSQYQTIMRMYERSKSVNLEEQRERIARVYEELPQLEKMDQEIASLAVSQARKLLEGDETALEKMKEEAARISKRRGELLAERGLPANYLERQYDCSLCKDTGYVEGKKCRCFLQKELELLYHQSGIRERIKTENFDTCTDLCYSDTEIAEGSGLTARQHMGKIIGKCKSFADSFDKIRENLVLYGSTGVGKSFLAGCIAKELIESYHSVVFLSATDLFDTMAKDRFDKDEEDDVTGSTQSILDCELLIIDDLGTELINSFSNSQLFYLLEKRLLAKRSTIITTNLRPNQLREEYSERVVSRLIENFTFLSFPKGDVRIWKRLRNR